MKSYVYRLYPHKPQAEKLDSLLYIARWLYNSALDERKHAWRLQRKSLNYYDQANQLKEIRQILPEVAELNYSSCQDMLKRLNKSYQAFYRRIKKRGNPGFPRFKGKNQFSSITFPVYGDGIKLIENKLRVQNVGTLKIKLHRSLEGAIKTVTIKKECGKWYAIFSCEVGTNPLPKSNKQVGIDVGLEYFAVTSDEEYIENPHYLREAESKLRRSQSSVSRKKKGSNSRHKAVKILAKNHQNVRRKRKDFHHKVAKQIVDNNGFIAVEKLQIDNMVKNHHLAKSINDAGWGQFIDILAYKAEYAGREFIKVPPQGTSQICSQCGAVVPKTLAVRTHRCPICGAVLHRDYNSALNVLSLGRRLGGVTWQNTACVPPEAVGKQSRHLVHH